MSDESSSWTDVAAESDLFDGAGIAVTPAGRDIVLYLQDGAVYATDNLCTHGQARLCDGFLDGYEIECPLHQGKFDVRSGKALCEPLASDVQTFPIKIEDGHVFVAL